MRPFVVMSLRYGEKLLITHEALLLDMPASSKREWGLLEDKRGSRRTVLIARRVDAGGEGILNMRT
jgi:hypothetical protein